MGYVIRTDALGKPMYFAGGVDAFLKPNLVLTDVLMNAWFFDQQDEAQRLIDDELGDGWSISTVSHGVSPNLQKPKKPKPTFENDLGLVAEYEYAGGCLLDVMEGRVADYARIRALKNRGVFDAMAAANAADWHAEKAWIAAFGTKKQQRDIGGA
jgi:hypothetical protein